MDARFPHESGVVAPRSSQLPSETGREASRRMPGGPYPARASLRLDDDLGVGRNDDLGFRRDREGTSITVVAGFALITLTSFTTASSSTTAVTPSVFSARSTAHRFTPSLVTDPRRTTVPPARASSCNAEPTNRLSHSIRRVTRPRTSRSCAVICPRAISVSTRERMFFPTLSRACPCAGWGPPEREPWPLTKSQARRRKATGAWSSSNGIEGYRGRVGKNAQRP